MIKFNKVDKVVTKFNLCIDIDIPYYSKCEIVYISLLRRRKLSFQSTIKISLRIKKQSLKLQKKTTPNHIHQLAWAHTWKYQFDTMVFSYLYNCFNHENRMWGLKAEVYVIISWMSLFVPVSLACQSNNKVSLF